MKENTVTASKLKELEDDLREAQVEKRSMEAKLKAVESDVASPFPLKQSFSIPTTPISRIQNQDANGPSPGYRCPDTGDWRKWPQPSPRVGPGPAGTGAFGTPGGKGMSDMKGSGVGQLEASRECEIFNAGATPLTEPCCRR